VCDLEEELHAVFTITDAHLATPANIDASTAV
jgi:hypothetical protein